MDMDKRNFIARRDDDLFVGKKIAIFGNEKKKNKFDD
jgi:hypothetical protein